MNVKEIREAKDELVKMSNDSTQREIYEMRAKILKDKVSALNKAKEEGREEGEKSNRYCKKCYCYEVTYRTNRSIDRVIKGYNK
ncbi:hypothetical protein JMF89_15090 [Clostridiaceae bacterium UIB06]|nr:hypothetical protein [Clostridiaceae bacterium UIB06]